MLLEAIEKNGQAQNGAAWYYLGRIYLVEGDITGADTAMAKAEKLAPQCAKDAQAYIQNGWAALMRAGNNFEEQKNLDSALVMYRQSAMLNPRSPLSHYYVAKVHEREGSARQRRGALWDGRRRRGKHHRHVDGQGAQSVRLQRRRDLPELRRSIRRPIATFERYLKWVPNDAEAKRGLAGAYRGAGQTDKAQAIEKELVASGPRRGRGWRRGTQDLMTAGVNLYNDKKYTEAAAAFEQVVAAAAVRPGRAVQPGEHLSRHEGRRQAAADGRRTWPPSSR